MQTHQQQHQQYKANREVPRASLGSNGGGSSASIVRTFGTQNSEIQIDDIELIQPKYQLQQPQPQHHPGSAMIDEGSFAYVDDQNNDECDICGIGGILICCDGCEKAYHAECLGVQPSLLPDPWFCPRCSKKCIGMTGNQLQQTPPLHQQYQLQQTPSLFGEVCSSGSIIRIIFAGLSMDAQLPFCRHFSVKGKDNDDGDDDGDDDCDDEGNEEGDDEGDDDYINDDYDYA